MWWANELWDGAIPATFERRGLSLSSPTVSERHAIRTGALAVTAAATVLPILMPVPRRLPATAMGSELLLYLERGLAVFAILVFLLVFLYRSLLHGELPKAISSRGPSGAISPWTRRPLRIPSRSRSMLCERTTRGSRRRSAPAVGFGNDENSGAPA
jgi:hypothetical protein